MSAIPLQALPARDRPVADIENLRKLRLMTLIEKIGEYLQRLSPHSRSSLLMELERLETCGAEIAGVEPVIEKLRAEFPKGTQPDSRANSPARYLFAPLEPMLVDGAAEHANLGHIQRGSLPAIWECISRDLLPTMTRDYIKAMDEFIAADNQKEARQAASTFQTKVYKYLESTLATPEGVDQTRAKLAAYTASRTAYDDLAKILCVLHTREELAKFEKALPANIDKFDDARIAKITSLLDKFAKANPTALPFALALVGKRLKVYWELIRLATKAAPSKNVADVAATPYALVISLVLDRIDDKRATLRAALKKSRVLAARDLLSGIYDTEYALRVRIDQLEASEWGQRLNVLMEAIDALVQAEISRFPSDVGHVLGSRSLRKHETLVGRLTYLAHKGRDALNGGAAYFRNLVGQA